MADMEIINPQLRYYHNYKKQCSKPDIKLVLSPVLCIRDSSL